MRAAVLHQYNVMPELEEVTVAEPQEGEVVVRIAASGICGSDVHLSHGMPDFGDVLPMILGHEGAGVIDTVGPGVTDLKRGDRVIIAMGSPCGHCEYCGEGRMQFCNGNPPRSTFGEMDDGTYRLSQGDTPVRSFVGIGSLGEYAVVKRRKLVKFDLDAAFETMCLISCGVTTGLGAALNSGEIRPGTHVLVFGCGGVGLSIIQGARIAGAARIIAVDNNSRKLDMAANLGATDCIMSPEDPADLVAEVRKILPRGVEVAFDAVGMRTDRLQYLMAATDMGGLTLAVGVLPMTETVPVLGRDLLLGARRLAGVRGGNGFPGLDIPRILKLYAAGLLKLDEMVGPKFELEEIGPAFESAAKADFARTVVRIAPSLL